MLKNKIARLLEEAAVEAQQRGLLPSVALPDITVEHPQNATHGDYAPAFP
jgi:arginyl-tRNA synthetase